MEPNQCTPLLEQGLYTTLQITKSGNFNYDLKRYYESNQFKEDFKSGKFNFGLDAAYAGIKAALSIGASEDEINTFQESIRQMESITVSQSFFDSFALHVPNKDLINGYVKCMEIQAGSKGLSTIVQEGEQEITVYIMYNKVAYTDSSPKVESYTLSNAIEISKSFEVNGLLDINNSITFKRINSDEDVFVFIDTDKGPVNKLIYGLPSGFNKDFPVGTIISSYLSWVEFQNVTKNNLNNPDKGIWNSKYSKWSPCDGRSIDSSSGLSRAANNLTDVPDLRGVFLRGYNKFDPDENQNGVEDVKPSQKDTDANRVRGRVQEDQIIEHWHLFGQANDQYLTGGHFVPGHIAPGDYPGVTTAKTSNFGGSETRPKNIAINYYIRIN